MFWFCCCLSLRKSDRYCISGDEHSKQLVNEIRRILTEPKIRFKAGGKVQRYFLDALELVWNDLRQYVDEEIKNNPSYKVWVTGHSLGGALASLASTLIMYEGKTSRDNLMLYTFGQPRVGNYDYARAHDGLVPLSFRVTHYRDIAVHLPTCHTGIPGSACIALGEDKIKNFVLVLSSLMCIFSRSPSRS